MKVNGPPSAPLPDIPPALPDAPPSFLLPDLQPANPVAAGLPTIAPWDVRAQQPTQPAASLIDLAKQVMTTYHGENPIQFAKSYGDFASWEDAKISWTTHEIMAHMRLVGCLDIPRRPESRKWQWAWVVVLGQYMATKKKPPRWQEMVTAYQDMVQQPFWSGAEGQQFLQSLFSSLSNMSKSRMSTILYVRIKSDYS